MRTNNKTGLLLWKRLEPEVTFWPETGRVWDCVCWRDSFSFSGKLRRRRLPAPGRCREPAAGTRGRAPWMFVLHFLPLNVDNLSLFSTICEVPSFRILNNNQRMCVLHIFCLTNMCVCVSHFALSTNVCVSAQSTPHRLSNQPLCVCVCLPSVPHFGRLTNVCDCPIGPHITCLTNVCVSARRTPLRPSNQRVCVCVCTIHRLSNQCVCVYVPQWTPHRLCNKRVCFCCSSTRCDTHAATNTCRYVLQYLNVQEGHHSGWSLFIYYKKHKFVDMVIIIRNVTVRAGEWLTVIAAAMNACFIAFIKYLCSVVDALRMFHDSSADTQRDWSE